MIIISSWIYCRLHQHCLFLILFSRFLAKYPINTMFVFSLLGRHQNVPESFGVDPRLPVAREATGDWVWAGAARGGGGATDRKYKMTSWWIEPAAESQDMLNVAVVLRCVRWTGRRSWLNWIGLYHVYIHNLILYVLYELTYETIIWTHEVPGCWLDYVCVFAWVLKPKSIQNPLPHSVNVCHFYCFVFIVQDDGGQTISSLYYNLLCQSLQRLWTT